MRGTNREEEVEEVEEEEEEEEEEREAYLQVLLILLHTGGVVRQARGQQRVRRLGACGDPLAAVGDTRVRQRLPPENKRALLSPACQCAGRRGLQ